MLQELTKTNITIHKNEETTIVYQKSNFAVRTDKGIRIFKLSHNMHYAAKKIDYTVSFIPIPKHSPSAEFFFRELFYKPMKNLEFTEMILDSAFWSHNPQLVEEMTSVTAISWSPEGIFENNEHVLAILNNIGNVEIYGPHLQNFESLLNLSQFIKDNTIEKDTPKNLESLITAVKAVQTISFCWGTKVDNSSLYFVTVQRNGNILIWLLDFQSKVKVKLQGMIETDQEIQSIKWLQKLKNTMLLICSNVSGQIYVYDCQITEHILVTNSTCLWSHKDRMVAKYLVYMVIDDRIALVCNKHRHLVIFLLDGNCNVLSQVCKNVNDNRITTIKNGEDCLYLSTVNSQLFKITLSIMSNNLNVNIDSIELTQYENSELYSFDTSTNAALWILGLCNRQVSHRKDTDKLDIVFFHKTEINEVEILLNNPTNKLTNVWDHLQILRCKCLKQRFKPEIDLVELYTEGHTNVYRLKLYLIFLTLFLTLKQMSRDVEEYVLPETSIEIVKEKILLAQARTVIKEFYNNFICNKHVLDSSQLEYFVGAKNFIKNYCTKYQRDISEFVNLSIWNLNKIEAIYNCQCCDEVFRGLSCSQGHCNMFCMITFTAIENDEYLFCNNCNSTASIRLFKKNPMCVFCDLYLTRC